MTKTDSVCFVNIPEGAKNNAAERSLRTVVMARKVSQCSKNAVGAQTYMRIKSTVETARTPSRS